MILILLLGLCNCTQTSDVSQPLITGMERGLTAPSFVNTEDMSIFEVAIYMLLMTVIIIVTSFRVKKYYTYQMGLLTTVALTIGIYEMVFAAFLELNNLLFIIPVAILSAFFTHYEATKMFMLPLAGVYPVAMTITAILGIQFTIIAFVLKVVIGFALFLLMVLSLPIFEFVFITFTHTFLTSCVLELTPLKLITRALTINRLSLAPLETLCKLLIFIMIPFYALVMPVISTLLLRLIVGGNGGSTK